MLMESSYFVIRSKIIISNVVKFEDFANISRKKGNLKV